MDAKTKRHLEDVLNVLREASRELAPEQMLEIADELETEFEGYRMAVAEKRPRDND